jgi:ankyrin repeat protein
MKTLRKPFLVVLAALALSSSYIASTLDTRLSEAAMDGDRGAVLSLLTQNVDVNIPQGDGSTALHWVAYHGDLELTRALLKAGAHVNAMTRIDAKTPLYMAAQNGNAAVIEELLEAGASAREANKNGTTVLMMATASGSADAVKVLLDRGAEINATENTNGQTALMFAAAYNRASAIRVLMQHGADPNLTTKAFKVERVQVKLYSDAASQAQAQARQAAQGDRPRGGAVVGGLGAMHFAAREGQMDAIRELVAGGADLNLISAGDKTPPMTEAIINAHLDIAKFLLDRGANPTIANADGLTPLYAAVDMRWRANSWYPQPNVAEEQTNYLDLMKDLLNRGANIDARLVSKLWYRSFRYGTDWVDPAGATPFWRAAQANDVDAMRLLTSRGADPNVPTTHGVTPLMVAAGIGFEYQLTNVVPDSRLPTAKYLIEEMRVNVNAKDDKAYTTLHGAAYVGNNELIKYLVSQGADVKARSKERLSLPGTASPADAKGDTVADMANGPREKSLLHPETVKLLESLGSENSHDCRSEGCVNLTKPDKPPGK